MPFLAAIFNPSKKTFSRLFVTLALITALGLSVAPHYGISWDEEATIGVVQVNYEIIMQGAKNDHQKYHRQYYGTWYNLAAAVIFKVENRTSIQRVETDPNEVMLAQIRSKHVFTFLLSMVTYAAVAGLVGILVGQSFSWLGPVVLLLIPRFWGNSFFNPKDIPLAALFTLGTLLGALLIRYYCAADRRQPVGLNAITGYTLAYGIMAGFVAGTRIDSSVIMLYAIAVDAGLQLSAGRSIIQVLQFCRFYGVMLAAGILTIFALYPAAWANPLQWYFSAFNFYYKEDWNHTVLFNGVDIPADQLPWHYLPTWFGITTPIAILTLFIIGWMLTLLKFRQLAMGQRACLLLVGLQTFGLPLFAMLYQATLFDTLRQVLYVLPGIAVMAAVAIAYLYQTLATKPFKLAFAGGLMALAIAIALDMSVLHPYEYLYFNRAFGGLPAAAERFDTDYWGVSMADAVNWVNQSGDRALPLVSTEPITSANLLAHPDITVISESEFEAADLPGKPFYYLSLPRWGWEKKFPDCPVVYSTTRQQVPLTRVKKCS